MPKTSSKRSPKNTESDESRLEKIRQSSQVWLAKYLSVGTINELSKIIMPCICRVEAPFIGKPLGSGFLIAPGLVLTNFHVLNEVPGNDELAVKCSKLEFRFEFIEFHSVKNPGTVFKAQKDNALLAFSPIAELDYALIRLDAVPLDANQTAISLWLKMSNRELILNEPIWVVQHPLGDPMQAGWGTILQSSSDIPYFQYSANTDRGSSGSPVLDIELNLIGLHHSGGPDPRRKEPDLGNEGIVLGKILPQIQQYIDEANSLPPKPKNVFELGDLALNIAKWFYLQDQDGMVDTINHHVSEIVQAFEGREFLEIEDALEELQKHQLVTVDWYGMEDGLVIANVGLLVAVYDQLGYDILYDMLLVARFVATSRDYILRTELKEGTDLEIPRLNRAVFLLKYKGWLEVERTLVTWPYAFAEVKANAETRNFVRENKDVP